MEGGVWVLIGGGVWVLIGTIHSFRPREMNRFGQELLGQRMVRGQEGGGRRK